MSAKNDEKTDDLFPVRDIQTDSRELAPRSQQRSRPPEDDLQDWDFLFNLKDTSLPVIIEKCYKLCQNWYSKAKTETFHAAQDIGNMWIETAGKRSDKLRVTSRLVMYYLITLAIYVIETCLWVDQKLLLGLYKMFVNSKKNTQLLIVLGIVFGLIVLAYIISSPCPEPQELCEK